MIAALFDGVSTWSDCYCSSVIGTCLTVQTFAFLRGKQIPLETSFTVWHVETSFTVRNIAPLRVRVWGLSSLVVCVHNQAGLLCHVTGQSITTTPHLT